MNSNNATEKTEQARTDAQVEVGTPSPQAAEHKSPEKASPIDQPLTPPESEVEEEPRPTDENSELPKGDIAEDPVDDKAAALTEEQLQADEALARSLQQSFTNGVGERTRERAGLKRKQQEPLQAPSSAPKAHKIDRRRKEWRDRHITPATNIVTTPGQRQAECPRPLKYNAYLYTPLPLDPRSEQLADLIERCALAPDCVYNENSYAETPLPWPPLIAGRVSVLDTPVIDLDEMFRRCGKDMKSRMFLEEFHKAIFEEDIVRIKSLAEVTGIKLDKFDADSLLNAVGNIKIDRRDQIFCPPETNAKGKWDYKSNYGQVQLEEIAKQHKIEILIPPQRIQGDAIVFGTNIDMKGPKWHLQLKELDKLPANLQIKNPNNNMLSHLHFSIDGVNELQAYCKVTGVRTPAHQENSRLASVNINIGPGECEWIAIGNEYWGKIYEMCEERGIQFTGGSYWPILADLEAAGIEYYRFRQREGEMVIVGYGCIHYVQAMGPTINIAYNIAPMTEEQYRPIRECNEFNKYSMFTSLVPFELMSWNMAEKAWFGEDNLYQEVKKTLIRSYAYQQQVYNWLVAKKRGENSILMVKPALNRKVTEIYCTKCNVEVFNIYLGLKRTDGTFSPFCAQCANEKGIDKFEAFMQRPLKELRRIIYLSSSYAREDVYKKNKKMESNWLKKYDCL